MLQQPVRRKAGLSIEPLQEYSLVVYPDALVEMMIEAERVGLESFQGSEACIGMKPFLALARFHAKEQMEATLSRWIGNICHLQSCFTVTLNNYTGAPSGDLYARVLQPQPLLRLANALKMLDGFIQANDCPPLQLPKPQLTVAANLPLLTYETAMKEFSQRSFHASFKVEKLFLLKTDPYMKTVIANSFALSSFQS